VIYVQIIVLSGNVVFHNLIRSKVGDIVNMYGVSEDRRDRCMRSARQLVTWCLFISCNNENEKKTSNAARNVSTIENFVVQEVPHTMVSELWRPQRHMVLVMGVEKTKSQTGDTT